MKKLLIFGCGYTAGAFTKTLDMAEWQITGTSRNQSKKSVQWPGTDLTHALSEATHLLISIAPNETGDPVLNELQRKIVTNSQHLTWVGYLSTTGVYGNHDGGWVDESSELCPATRRGELRVAAEEKWQSLAARSCLPLHIFRLAGIYGPGRGPFTKIEQGRARRIIKAGQVFSRIHVDDISQVLMASIKKPNPGRVYNVCDDLAAPPEDVLAFAAELLNYPIPIEEDFATADLSAMARSFYSESKRVSNRRIKNELGISLKYPTYREGLLSLLKLRNS